MIGASALGVNNILCLGGDDPKNGDQPETKAVNDIDSLTLVSTANMMRKEKKFPSGRTIDPSPKLFIGGAEVPTQGKPNPDKILKKLSLNSKMHSQCRYLSQGQKQKLALTRLFCSNKKIWLLDEPFSFLDEEASIFLLNKNENLRQNNGLTVIVSHQNLIKNPDLSINLGDQ